MQDVPNSRIVSVLAFSVSLWLGIFGNPRSDVMIPPRECAVKLMRSLGTEESTQRKMQDVPNSRILSVLAFSVPLCLCG
jgi:hypothetical protein